MILLHIIFEKKTLKLRQAMALNNIREKIAVSIVMPGVPILSPEVSATAS